MRRFHLHRPSPAIVISLIALCFAMSGTAVAATGGTFILGRANTASSLTSLTNTKGAALSLSSTPKQPPLKVSNSVQVPRLNASELDGRTSSAFLPASGTAVNSSELGGVLASGYMQGGGDTTATRLALPGQTDDLLMSSPGASLLAICDPLGVETGSSLSISGNSGAATGETAVWWNPGGVDGNSHLATSEQAVTPDNGLTTPYMVVVQVDNVTSVSTFTASEWYDSASNSCHFTSQLVTTNG